MPVKLAPGKWCPTDRKRRYPSAAAGREPQFFLRHAPRGEEIVPRDGSTVNLMDFGYRLLARRRMEADDDFRKVLRLG